LEVATQGNSDRLISKTSGRCVAVKKHRAEVHFSCARVLTICTMGTLISNDNSVQKEIQRRILAGNRTYFATISLFGNRLLSRATKIRLYKALIRPVVTYGAETWTMTRKEE
jgi:hypothetical protein